METNNQDFPRFENSFCFNSLHVNDFSGVSSSFLCEASLSNNIFLDDLADDIRDIMCSKQYFIWTSYSCSWIYHRWNNILHPKFIA